MQDHSEDAALDSLRDALDYLDALALQHPEVPATLARMFRAVIDEPRVAADFAAYFEESMS